MKLDSCRQIIEIAQFEDAKDREARKNRLEHLISCNKLLLEERGQEIQLAKMFCLNSIWKITIGSGSKI